jgi:hypothetical protein
MSEQKQPRRPTPEEVEQFKRTTLDFLEDIIRCRQEHVVGAEFMDTLRDLIINPVREDLREGVDIDAVHRLHLRREVTR